MTIDERILLARKLIAQREEIDQQLNALFGGSAISKKQPCCSHCGNEGHNAKTCPEKLAVNSEPFTDRAMAKP